jgi:HAD superfamily hydrolase (TIGR01490 family)
MTKTQLVLFDFDGTLTSGDSLWHFLRFAVPLPRLVWGALCWGLWLAGVLLRGKYSAGRAKERLLSQFFKGWTQDELAWLGTRFFRSRLPGLLRINVLRLLRHYKSLPDTQVVLVSASADVWLRPFCAAEGIALLCSEFRYMEGRFTGHFVHGNCNGTAKAERVRSAYDLTRYQRVVAYGNSRGDFPMFGLAQEAWMVKRSGTMCEWLRPK